VGERIRSIKPWTGQHDSPGHVGVNNISSGHADRRVKREPELPVCFNNNDFVKRFLEERFPSIGIQPKCGCSRCQHLGGSWHADKIDWECLCRPCRNLRNRATWLIVIVEFYRENKPASNLETRHRWSPGTVCYIAQRIRRAAAGLRLDGKVRTGRPRGNHTGKSRTRVKTLAEISPFVESAALTK
jgi:hypothetical protein